MRIFRALREQSDLLSVRITLLFTAIFLGVAFYLYSALLGYLHTDISQLQQERAISLLTLGTNEVTATLKVEYPMLSASDVLTDYSVLLVDELTGQDVAVFTLQGDVLEPSTGMIWPARINNLENYSRTQAGGVNTLPLADGSQATLMPVIFQGKQVGWQAIYIDLTREQKLYQSMVRQVMGALLVTLAMVLAGGVYLRSFTRRNMKPLLAITEQLAQSKWDAELPAPLNGEFRQLGDSINMMKQNLAQFERQRQTILDRVSHDILGPLKTVSMIASVYQNSPTTPSSNSTSSKSPVDPAREDWGIVYTCSEHVNRLLEDLKYMVGQQRIEYVRSDEENQIDLVPVAQQLVAYYRLKTQKRRVQITGILPEDSVSAPIERTRFAQILGNLVDNALNHGRATQIEIELRQSLGWVTLEVRDNGIGIDPNVLPYIFEEGVSTGKKPGVSHRGLGLSIVSDIVQGHDGVVQASSLKGRGACFTVLLPTAPSKEGESVKIEAAVPIVNGTPPINGAPPVVEPELNGVGMI